MARMSCLWRLVNGEEDRWPLRTQDSASILLTPRYRSTTGIHNVIGGRAHVEMSWRWRADTLLAPGNLSLDPPTGSASGRSRLRAALRRPVSRSVPGVGVGAEQCSTTGHWHSGLVESGMACGDGIEPRNQACSCGQNTALHSEAVLPGEVC